MKTDMITYSAADPQSISRPADKVADGKNGSVPPEHGTISSARRAKIGVLQGLMRVSFVLILALLACMIGYIIFRGAAHVTWTLVSTNPSLLNEKVF